MCGAFLAGSGHLDEANAGLELGIARGMVDSVEDLVAIDLLHGAAFFAAQKNRRPASARLIHSPASEVSVLALETMDDTCLQQRVQGPVDRYRREPCPFLGQAIQDLIGADARLRRSDFLENLAAQIGETDILFREYGGRLLMDVLARSRVRWSSAAVAIMTIL